MRILIFVFHFLSILFSNVVSAQITFSDMSLLLIKDISQSEDFLIAKKYKFYNLEERSECVHYDFAKNKDAYSDNADAFITIIDCKNYKTIHQTVSDETIIPKIKLDATKNGLKFIQTDNWENTIIHIYRNQYFELLIMSRSSKTGLTIYEIALEKL